MTTSTHFLDFLAEQGLRRVAAGDLLELGIKHKDPLSACYQKNHVPPEVLWPEILPFAKALERVRAATRTTIEVVSAFHSGTYQECLSANGKPPRRHLTFQAMALSSRTFT